MERHVPPLQPFESISRGFGPYQQWWTTTTFIQSALVTGLAKTHKQEAYLGSSAGEET